MPVGQSTETQEVETVQQTMTLDLSLDDFAAQREALIQRLATQYNVDPSLITLEASAVRRRARALQSGGLELTITIATSDGAGNQVDISTIENAASAVDATTLAATISEVTVAAGLPPVIVTALQVPARATAAIEVPFSCPAGKWCTAGLVVDCPLGTYNPLEDQDFATACIMCPLSSYTSDTNSTSRAQCVCDEGFYDANASMAVDQALIDNLFNAGKDPVIMMADVIDCRICPVGTDCSQLGATLEALPLVPGYYRLDNTTNDVRGCPDARKNCSTTFGTELCESSSGCSGGVSGCAPGLSGVFCELCDRSNRSEGLVYYTPATDDVVATCKECGNTLASTLALAIVGVVAIGLLVIIVLFLKRQMSAKTNAQMKRYNETFTPMNKVKVIMTFCAPRTALRPAHSRSPHGFLSPVPAFASYVFVRRSNRYQGPVRVFSRAPTRCQRRSRIFFELLLLWHRLALDLIDATRMHGSQRLHAEAHYVHGATAGVHYYRRARGPVRLEEEEEA